MKFGVVIFPGSNCDHDIIYVLKKIMKQEVVKLWHKDISLQGCDFIVLPGGFSYGDYLRSGAIARFSPIMESVIKYAKKSGCLMGICNGFQILCEAGLLPGALLQNNNQKFICKNIYVKAQTNNSIVTNLIDQAKPLKIPIAHGEGRYYADNDTIRNLNQNDQILFRYCNENGEITDDSNPNGSLENIAGVCNESRNIFGMMPHPERAADVELKNTDGKLIFESILNFIK
ncbi:MAG: phosphoribosylformylglycinamidine synthase subunit PurQ [Bacteroidales bacterium]